MQFQGLLTAQSRHCMVKIPCLKIMQKYLKCMMLHFTQAVARKLNFFSVKYDFRRAVFPLCRNQIRVQGDWGNDATPRSFPIHMSIVVHTRDRCPDDYCCFSSSIRPAELSNFPHANFHWLPTPKQYFPHKNKTDIGFLL